MSVEMAVVLLLGAAAVFTDLRTRSIPNWIPVSALAGGVACQVAGKGWAGLPAAGFGALLGFGVFLVFYLLGGMGGGDVKLMTGFGALLGGCRLLSAALWTAAVGGLIALGAVGVWWIRSKLNPSQSPSERPKAIPYAPAIAIGVLLALVQSK